MKKRMLFGLLGLLSIIVSCEVVQRNKQSEPSTESDKKDTNGRDDNIAKLSDNAASGGQDNNPSNKELITSPTSPDSREPTPRDPHPQPWPVTQFDSAKLDAAVTEQAIKFGKDPKTYRMLYRTEPDGTKIYRMLGLFVIVNPNGEKVYLPDEI